MAATPAKREDDTIDDSQTENEAGADDQEQSAHTEFLSFSRHYIQKSARWVLMHD